MECLAHSDRRGELALCHLRADRGHNRSHGSIALARVHGVDATAHAFTIRFITNGIAVLLRDDAMFGPIGERDG